MKFRNRLICKVCDAVIESTGRYDFVVCDCKGDHFCYVDGGNSDGYFRCGGWPENIIEFHDDVNINDLVRIIGIKNSEADDFYIGDTGILRYDDYNKILYIELNRNTYKEKVLLDNYRVEKYNGNRLTVKF